MKHLGDITKINWLEVEPVDVVTGGSPCQDLSVAGKRAGLAGERSGLYMEQIRCVKELRQADVQRGRTGVAIRPRFMVWENVPGAFSSGSPKGADFAAVIEEIIKVAEPGAVVHVCVPDRGWNKSGCYYAEDGSWSVAWRVHDAQFWGVPQRRKRISLVADFGGLAAPEVLFERKGLSGNFEQGGAQEEETAEAVRDGTTGAKFYGTGGYNSEGMKSTNPHSGIYKAETSRTLDINGGSLACNQGGVAVVQDIKCYGMDNERRRGPDEFENVSPALTARAGTGPLMANSHPGSYCGQDAYQDMLIAHCLKAKGNCDHREDSETYPVQNNVVRRLTPLECERLQGYPDGWTDIGEWVDTKEKKHKEADSPRYKAIGNSIALPFWCWLAKRISAQYERDITMGSLFDGIGGFPYAFEKCGGKAVWASEIEEFPIAVTKIRFPE